MINTVSRLDSTLEKLGPALARMGVKLGVTDPDLTVAAEAFDELVGLKADLEHDLRDQAGNA